MHGLVEELMEELCPRYGPGASLLIARNGHVLLHRGYGYADIAQGIPADPDSAYLIASR